MNERVKLFSKNFTMNKTEVERSIIKNVQKKKILDEKLARQQKFTNLFLIKKWGHKNKEPCSQSASYDNLKFKANKISGKQMLHLNLDKIPKKS